MAKSNYYLHIDRMVILSIDVLVFIHGRRLDADMRSIDTSDDVWKPSLGIKFRFLHIRLLLCGETDRSWHLLQQGYGDSVDDATRCGLCDTDQFTDGALECPGSIKPQGQHQLQVEKPYHD